MLHSYYSVTFKILQESSKRAPRVTKRWLSNRFVRTCAGLKILFLELGVGYNTPVIIKYPFWHMTAKNPKAVYACINLGEADAPDDIAARSICIDGDIGAVLEGL